MGLGALLSPLLGGGAALGAESFLPSMLGGVGQLFGGGMTGGMGAPIAPLPNPFAGIVTPQMPTPPLPTPAPSMLGAATPPPAPPPSAPAQIKPRIPATPTSAMVQRGVNPANVTPMTQADLTAPGQDVAKTPFLNDAVPYDARMLATPPKEFALAGRMGQIPPANMLDATPKPVTSPAQVTPRMPTPAQVSSPDFVLDKPSMFTPGQQAKIADMAGVGPNTSPQMGVTDIAKTPTPTANSTAPVQAMTAHAKPAPPSASMFDTAPPADIPAPQTAASTPAQAASQSGGTFDDFRAKLRGMGSDPMAQIGLSLLAAGHDSKLNPYTQVASGLANASKNQVMQTRMSLAQATAAQKEQERQREEELRLRTMAMLGVNPTTAANREQASSQQARQRASIIRR